jgi:hypothetical protein
LVFDIELLRKEIVVFKLVLFRYIFAWFGLSLDYVEWHRAVLLSEWTYFLLLTLVEDNSERVSSLVGKSDIFEAVEVEDYREVCV